jgi:hypothetical protein
MKPPLPCAELVRDPKLQRGANMDDVESFMKHRAARRTLILEKPRGDFGLGENERFVRTKWIYRVYVAAAKQDMLDVYFDEHDKVFAAECRN